MDNNIKKTIYKTVDDIVSIPDLNKLSTIQKLFYLCYGSQVQNCKFVTAKNIVEKWSPSFDINDDNEDDDEMTRIDVKKLHEYLLSNDYEFCYINYDYYYVSKNKYNAVLYLCVDGLEVYTYDDYEDLYKELQSNMTTQVLDDDKNEVGILVRGTMGYTMSYLQFKKMDIDITKTYNDDLPIEAVSNFINNENTGLCLFYGEPGTGKSTFIKYLIQEYKKHFIILNADILYDSTSNSLISEFIENKDAIYIIEDCEKLLVSRDNQQNPLISAFLNMTDGILAEVISCKFICTFNTALTNIDNALLRKGRLKLKYEFKKLSKDKVHELIPELNEDMSVADVFNYKKENDFSKKITRKIGF